MKIFIYALFIFTTLGFSQITLEHEYEDYFLRVADLDDSGIHYYYLDDDNYKVAVYNSEHEHLKDIDIINFNDGSDVSTTGFLRKNLFNEGIAFMCFYNGCFIPNSVRGIIYDFDGEVIKNIPQISWAKFVKTSLGTKMMAYQGPSPYGPIGYSIFSVPGSIESESEKPDKISKNLSLQTLKK